MNEQTVRIPFFVESQRGDDKLGTNNTGVIISDHEAQIQGVPFQQGVPQNQIQQAVETQLKADKWVCIEKQDGTTDLLTKKDLPKLYPAVTPAPKPEQQQVDWRTVFAVSPPAPPKTPPATKTATAQTPTATAQTTTPTTCSTPKKPAEPKEQWVSIFENIKSATATHKGKGG